MFLVVSGPCLTGMIYAGYFEFAKKRYLKLLCAQRWVNGADVAPLLDLVPIARLLGKGSGVNVCDWILSNLATAIENMSADEYMTLPPKYRRRLMLLFPQPNYAGWFDAYDPRFRQILGKLVALFRETDSIDVLPALKRTLRSPKRLLNRNTDLRSNIEECIEYLQSRSGDIQRSSLLRAAAGPTTELLRAAGGPQLEQQPATLMRASFRGAAATGAQDLNGGGRPGCSDQRRRSMTAPKTVGDW